jgi:DNA-directed RNA polymerase subunit RPC12/RpoP
MRQVYGTDRQMACTACGTTGIRPRVMKTQDRFFIYTEAKYVCHRCGNYFHKGAISKEAITNDSTE